MYCIFYCTCCFKGGRAMRSCVWSSRALSPALLPWLFSDTRCCGRSLDRHGLWSTVRFLATAQDSHPTPLPSQARVVICGGGIVGTSVAYHLAKLGWTEIVLLEQGRWVLGKTCTVLNNDKQHVHSYYILYFQRSLVDVKAFVLFAKYGM